MVAAIPAGAFAWLALGAGPADADALDVEGDPDITIDLSTAEVGDEEPPSFTVPLRVRPDDTTQELDLDELHFAMFDGDVPLDETCDFVYAEGLPDLPVETALDTEANFEQRNVEACDLAATEADELTARSTDITDGVLTVTIERPPSLPVGSLGNTLRVAIVTTIGVLYLGMAMGSFLDSDQSTSSGKSGRRNGALRLVGSVLWPVRRRDGGFWMWRRTEHPQLAWTFKDSWLTNFTAVGAILATLLEATDVLDAIGVPNGQRSAFVLVNIGAVALAATAPIAYAGLRSHTETLVQEARRRVDIVARTTRKDDKRKVQVWTSAMRYTTGSNGGLDLQVEPPHAYPPDPSSALGAWAGDDATVLAVRIPVEWPPDGPSPSTAEKDLTCVGLPLPAASTHPADAQLRFEASVPELKIAPAAAGRSAVLARTNSTRKHSESGTYAGFFVAALVAAVGVSMQLSATWQIVDESSVASGTAWVVKALIAVLLFLATVYVLSTLANRPRVVESGRSDLKAAAQVAERVAVGEVLPSQDIAVETVPSAVLRSVGRDMDDQTVEDLVKDLSSEELDDLLSPVPPSTVSFDNAVSFENAVFNVARDFYSNPPPPRWVTPPTADDRDYGPRTYIVAEAPGLTTSRGDDTAF